MPPPDVMVAPDRPAAAGQRPLGERRTRPVEEAVVPDYLRDWYSWAYLNRRALALFDHPLVVSAILWGNFQKLQRVALAELRLGQRVLQPACVSGGLSPNIAAFLGPDGRLDVSDVAPLQVENCRHKLRAFVNTSVLVSDAATLGGGDYDAVRCFFLLHEMPAHYKRAVVDALLSSVRPGGKVVFVDYHQPRRAHPLKAVMNFVFDTLEPFAKELWAEEIRDFADDPAAFAWRKETYFGGLYQKVVAHRAEGV